MIKTEHLLPILTWLAMTTSGFAQMANDAVALPDAYKDAIHYASVSRGAITEEIYAPEEVVAAARAGEPFPEGAVITMEMFRDGDLARIFVMEKRSEWADLSQSGSWLYRGFAPDGTPVASDDGSACEFCHAAQADNDYVFTRDSMLE